MARPRARWAGRAQLQIRVARASDSAAVGLDRSRSRLRRRIAAWRFGAAIELLSGLGVSGFLPVTLALLLFAADWEDFMALWVPTDEVILLVEKVAAAPDLFWQSLAQSYRHEYIEKNDFATFVRPR